MPKFYQVGGSVRDELLGVKSKDIDYAVEASSYDEMKTAVLARGGEIFLETPQYLTIRAKVKGLGAADFTLCRKDGNYSDGRHPDSVQVGTIWEDLARRDFTINAMAKDEDGGLLDPFHGRHDLDTHLLKCVGNAKERFQEDGLRMLRAIRFAITKNLWLHDDIRELLSDNEFIAEHLTGVSTERVREELLRCFQHDTYGTMALLDTYPHLSWRIFTKFPIWLKPTMEEK